MNVLFTCAGRRNYLLQYFRDALAGRGKVCAADANPDASALQEADEAFVVPPVVEPDYLDRLLALCRKHSIRLLFSLSDLELPLLSRQRSRFLAAGTRPVVSSPEVVDTCWDKQACVSFLQQSGIRAPKTFLSLAEARSALSRGDVAFPLAVKPRWGTASVGVFFAEDDAELEHAHALLRRMLPRTTLAGASAADADHSVLIQERLRGQEYGLDVINDLEGRYVCSFVKRKLGMRNGETDRAVTVASAPLDDLGRRIGESLGHVAILDADVFYSDDIPCVLELNPRFGGGYPFSHAAGANLPAALIAWDRGEEPDPAWLRVNLGLVSGKCDRLVVKRTRP
jgi:carbamoyl-phosphate synthase large subunit